MELITWNVQWCRGVDGRVDPARIAAVARRLADVDVLCLQEVAVNFPGLGGSAGEDQIAALAAALPGYQPLYAAATDVWDGHAGRSQFGNAIFARLPVVQVYRHLLPWPADPSVPSMQRVALEAVVLADAGPVRIITTHLEYYSTLQRLTQVNALRRLHAEACGHARHPRPGGDPGEPFEAFVRPASAIVCGDFNFTPESLEHARMVDAFEDETPPFVDVWAHRHPGMPHPQTWGLYDDHPKICCDFVFATRDLADRTIGMEIVSDTDASDHQPVRVTFGCP